jgi:cytochrome c oxidase subunit 3
LGPQVGNGKNFIKGEYGAIETKGGSSTLDKDGKRVALAEFAATLPEVETIDKRQRKWFMEEGALPSYSVAEVQAGFKAHPDLIRTEI